MRLGSAAVLALFVLAACPPPTNDCVDDCAGGGAGGGTSNGGGTTSSGGGLSTGGGGGSPAGGGGTGTGGGSCTESWTCGYWLAAQPRDGGAERTCIDTNGCGTTAQRPPLSAPLPALDLPFYQCSVQPVLAKSCAMVGCHGQLDPKVRPFQVYARGRQRANEIIMVDRSLYGCLQTGTVPININDVGTGTSSCNAKARLSANEWASDFDSARALMVGAASPDQSELLTEPLWGSSFTHAGIKLWHTTSSDYLTVRAWLMGVTASLSCNNATNN
jgi:hypothetical protein